MNVARSQAKVRTKSVKSTDRFVQFQALPRNFVSFVPEELARALLCQSLQNFQDSGHTLVRLKHRPFASHVGLDPTRVQGDGD